MVAVDTEQRVFPFCLFQLTDTHIVPVNIRSVLGRGEDIPGVKVAVTPRRALSLSLSLSLSAVLTSVMPLTVYGCKVFPFLFS